MNAYYNEFDPYAAAWLRNLIDAGHIAPGVVDTRDVRDVRPADLDGFTQCHFFAGVGVWSYALRLAGISDEEPLWTASCPCQPFSAAGAGLGIADERHLWPVIDWLIEQCRPPKIFGEQVASKDGLNWLDTVSADLEAADYAIGAVDTCAAGFGAPHIRQRIYFAAHDLRPPAMGLANTSSDGHRQQRSSMGRAEETSKAGLGQRERLWDDPAYGSSADHLAQPAGVGCNPWPRLSEESARRWGRQLANPSDADGLGNTNVSRLSGSGKLGRPGHSAPGQDGQVNRDEHDGWAGKLADADGCNTGPEREQRGREHGQQSKDSGLDQRVAYPDTDRRISPAASRLSDQEHHAESRGQTDRPGPTNGFWRDADWLFCRDGKWRPVRSGSFPLASRSWSRMGRLRAYGNAICAEQATGFIRAYMEREMVDLNEAPAGDLFEWGV